MLRAQDTGPELLKTLNVGPFKLLFNVYFILYLGEVTELLLPRAKEHGLSKIGGDVFPTGELLVLCACAHTRVHTCLGTWGVNHCITTGRMCRLTSGCACRRRGKDVALAWHSGAMTGSCPLVADVTWAQLGTVYCALL